MTDKQEEKQSAALNEDDNDDDHKEMDLKEVAIVDISEYAVNYKHVHIQITEFADSMEVSDDHSAYKLLDIYDKMDISQEDIKLWQLSTKQYAKSGMKTVIEYAEKNEKASPDIKTKIRIITKMMMELETKNKKQELNEYRNILLLLGSHGNVCHVLKEVAINNGYGMMTNNLDQYIKSQSLQQQILKALYSERRLLVEKLHHAFKFSNNVHYIASFHNELAKDIGLREYNDHQYIGVFPNSSSVYPNWKNGLKQRYFKTLYTKENIIKCIRTQIDEKKIGYQKIVGFFEKNCPKHIEKTEFLQMVINIDNGEIHEKYMFWLLAKLDIFMVKDKEWKEIEKCWEYDDIIIKN